MFSISRSPNWSRDNDPSVIFHFHRSLKHECVVEITSDFELTKNMAWMRIQEPHLICHQADDCFFFINQWSDYIRHPKAPVDISLWYNICLQHLFAETPDTHLPAIIKYWNNSNIFLGENSQSVFLKWNHFPMILLFIAWVLNCWENFRFDLLAGICLLIFVIDLFRLSINYYWLCWESLIRFWTSLEKYHHHENCGKIYSIVRLHKVISRNYFSKNYYCVLLSMSHPLFTYFHFIINECFCHCWNLQRRSHFSII